jgi:V/A-type H+-transporting ATPase subunit F
MYKIVVITDPENAYGYRLAGVDVVPVKSTEEARKELSLLINDDRSGIIAVSEDFIEAMGERIAEKIKRIYRPIVIPIPSGRHLKVTDERREYLASLIRRAIGFDIRLRQG